MTYSQDVYLRFYEAMVSFGSWIFYYILIVILAGVVGICHVVGHKYKASILYAFIVFLCSSFVVRFLAWILLPSPEYLGLLK